MDPNIWGPHLWFFLHSMSFAYAKNKNKPTLAEKYHMYQFLESLKYVLPCSCKDNYAKHFDSCPPTLNTRKELFEWLVDLHNKVNKQTNKVLDKNRDQITPRKNEKVSYKEVEIRYIDIYNKKSKSY